MQGLLEGIEEYFRKLGDVKVILRFALSIASTFSLLFKSVLYRTVLYRIVPRCTVLYYTVKYMYSVKKMLTVKSVYTVNEDVSHNSSCYFCYCSRSILPACLTQ
jgi:hypothetical protein